MNWSPAGEKEFECNGRGWYDGKGDELLGRKKTFLECIREDIKINMIGEKDDLPVHLCDKCDLPIKIFVVVQSLSYLKSLRPHGFQHTRLPCSLPSPRACSNSCPLSQWCHPTISAYCPLFLLPPIFPCIRVFSKKSALHIRWPKYWNFSFSISPSSEYAGLISFRIDWFDLLAVQGTLKSSPAPQFKCINSSALSLLYKYI